MQNLQHTRPQTQGLKALPKAHQIFRYARPLQFTAKTRKRRITQERDRRTVQALSHFERGLGVWASRQTVLRELRVMEARREPSDQMSWSLATHKRSLGRLEESGVERRHGIRHEGRKKWGTRERTLHPERLLPRFEREPSIRSNVNRRSFESEPLEVKGFEKSDSRANSHHPNQKQKRDDDRTLSGKDFSKPTERKAKTKSYPEQLAELLAQAKAAILRNDPGLGADVVDTVLDDVRARAHGAGTVIGSTEYLLKSFWNFMEPDNLIDQHEEATRLLEQQKIAGPRGPGPRYSHLICPEAIEPDRQDSRTGNLA